MLGQRVMELLNSVPIAFSTPAVEMHCKEGLRYPRSTIREQLRRLERCKKVVKVRRDGERVVRWMSVKFYRED